MQDRADSVALLSIYVGNFLKDRVSSKSSYLLKKDFYLFFEKKYFYLESRPRIIVLWKWFIVLPRSKD